MNEYTVFSLISSSVFQMCFFYRFLFFVNSVNDKGVNTALGCVSYSYPSSVIYFNYHSLRISNIFRGNNFPRLHRVWTANVLSSSDDRRVDNHLNSFVKWSSTETSVTAYDLNERPCSALSEMKPVTTNRNLSSWKFFISSRILEQIPSTIDAASWRK